VFTELPRTLFSVTPGDLGPVSGTQAKRADA
jgi:hypothetical protein